MADEAGVRLEPDDLWTAVRRLGPMGGEGGCPPLVTGFVSKLLQGRQADRILDPWVGQGVLLAAAVDVVQPNHIVGRHPNHSALEVARRWLPSADLGTTGPGGELAELTDEFDVVVSSPPFGMRGGKVVLIRDVEVRDDAGHQLIVQAADLLGDDGIGVFVVAPRFLWSQGSRAALKVLSELNLHLDAFFDVPSGAFQPLTSIPTGIAVVRRGRGDGTVFVGQVSDDDRHNTTLVANYSKRKQGRSPELGSVQELASYRGMEQLLAVQQVAKLSRRMGVAPTTLGEVSLSIERLRGTARPEDSPDAFFFPLNLRSPIRESADELPQTLSNFVRVEVDPAKADVSVVVGFLRSPLGELVRQQVSTGTVISAMPISEVENLQLWLPDLDTQQRVAAADRQIRTLTNELNELRDRLWGRLTRADSVIAEVERVNREDTFSDWIDTLPFPLSSVLWTFHTLQARPLKRYLQLEYFFEALAQFLAVVVMSGVRRDAVFFEQEWAGVRTTLQRGHMSLERATFGTWMAIYERLSKVVRSGLSDADARTAWLRHFAIDDPDLLAALVDKRMVVLLKKANEYRNAWRGHGGVVGDAEARRREALFSELLVEFRSLVGRRWGSYPLVLPISGKFSSGLYQHTVQVAMGVRIPFETSTVELKAPLEDGVMHAISPRSGEVCPILPLVRLGPSPSSVHNACYFFNRVEGEELRWISFHFEQRPELVEPFGGVMRLLASLTGDG